MKPSRLSRYIPKCKGYRFALICIVICIVADVCGEIFFAGDVRSLTGTKAWFEWILRMVALLGLAPVMGAFILFGIRHLRRE